MAVPFLILHSRQVAVNLRQIHTLAIYAPKRLQRPGQSERDTALPKKGGMELVSTEENKALVRRWLEEGYNKGNVAVVDQIIAADYINYSAPHGQMPGQEAEKRYIAMIRAAFSDFSLAIEDQIAEGDKVVTRLTTSGTYRGGLPDIPSAAVIGKRVAVGEILIHRIIDGRVVEGWIEFDQLGLWRQLGIFSTI